MVAGICIQDEGFGAVRLCCMAPKAPSSSGCSWAKKNLVLDGCFLTPDSDSGVQVDLVLAPSAQP